MSLLPSLRLWIGKFIFLCEIAKLKKFDQLIHNCMKGFRQGGSTDAIFIARKDKSQRKGGNMAKMRQMPFIV